MSDLPQPGGGLGRRTDAVRPKRTQAERRARTRKKLLDAAVKVIRKRGYLGFTMVEAAKVAGLTRGAPLHHFSTSAAFQMAALEHLFESTLGASAQAGGGEETVDAILEAIVNDARASYFRDEFFSGVDVMISASKHPKARLTVRGLSERYREPIEAMWSDRLAAKGVDPVVGAKVVGMLYAVVRGVAIRSLIMENPAEVESMLQFSLVAARTLLSRA